VVSGTALLCVIPAVIAALPVQSSPVTAAALRARVQASASVPYVGYAESSVNLGLPVLPNLRDVSTLLDGTTDQYVWYRSPAYWRADAITNTTESDAYQDGQVTFLWNYGSNLFTQITGNQPVRLPRAADLLPPALARRLLSTASAADHIARLPSRRVAGVDAVGLQLTPSDPRTTIGTIDIWADPATGLPVEVQIFTRGATQPVLTSNFLELSMHRPALDIVTPHPASGVGLSTTKLPDVAGALNGDGDGDGDTTPFAGQLGGLNRAVLPGSPSGVAFYGAGLSRIVLLPLPGELGESALNSAIQAGANALSIAGQTGVLIHTPLLNVLMVQAGFRHRTFLLTGAVTPVVLEKAAISLVKYLSQPHGVR
jgi:hypothetical protein